MLQKQIGLYFLRGEKEKHVCSVARITSVMSMLLILTSHIKILPPLKSSFLEIVLQLPELA